MIVEDIQDYVRLLPAVDRAPHHAVRLTYDVEADTFSVSFTKPGHATDSEMTDDDVIIRYVLCKVTRSSDSPSCMRADERRRSR